MLSGAALGPLWMTLLAVTRPPASLLDLTLAALTVVVGGIAFGLGGSLVVGAVLALPHVLVAAALPLPRRARLYRWLMRGLAVVVGLLVSRLGLAVIAYVAIDFNWDLGWNREDFPTLASFLTLIILPMTLTALGACWATDRVTAWRLQPPTAAPPAP